MGSDDREVGSHPMKFEPGKTYKTRSGEDALIYCVDEIVP